MLLGPALRIGIMRNHSIYPKMALCISATSGLSIGLQTWNGSPGSPKRRNHSEFLSGVLCPRMAAESEPRHQFADARERFGEVCSRSLPASELRRHAGVDQEASRRRRGQWQFGGIHCSRQGTVVTKKARKHFKKMLKKFRVEGFCHWQKAALGTLEAQIPVQSGTIRVEIERFWSTLLTHMPASAPFWHHGRKGADCQQRNNLQVAALGLVGTFQTCLDRDQYQPVKIAGSATSGELTPLRLVNSCHFTIE